MNGATARQGAGDPREARPPIAAAHLRTDPWWALPLTVVVVLLSFIVYSTWAAFQNAHYFVDPYLSPFYSPCLDQGVPAPQLRRVGPARLHVPDHRRACRPRSSSWGARASSA